MVASKPVETEGVSGWARFLAAYGGLAEVVRDLHAYLGILLASLGTWAVTARPGAGLLTAGVALFYLGKWGRR